MCLWIPRRRLMEVPQIILRELHRKYEQSLHRIKYRINLCNHKQSFKEKVLFGNKHNVPAAVMLITRATIITKQLPLSTPDISVNNAYSCMGYSYTVKEEARFFRNADTTYQTTRCHTPEHRNLHTRNALQAVRVNAG